MKTAFVIIFIVLYLLANELTYMIAVHQQMGLCRHVWAGGVCWINRIIMAIPCVWYCGWIVGLILIAFAIFGIHHMTVGWVLALPSLFVEDERTIITHTELECGLLLPLTLVCLIFVILSFIFTPFKSAIDILGSTTSLIVIIAILVVGFIVRGIVLRNITKNQ